MLTVINYCSKETIKFCQDQSKRSNTLLDSSVEKMLRHYLSSISSTTLTDEFIDAFNRVLTDLSLCGTLKISEEKTMSGLFVITEVLSEDISKMLISTVVRERQKLPPEFNLSSKVDESFNMLLSNKKNNVPFETFVAYKFIRKQYNALTRGIEFTLTLSDMRKLLRTKKCHYSGAILTLDGIHKLTLDRIDSTKGYTKENTCACSSLVNEMKNKLLEETDFEHKFGDNQLLKNTLKSFSEVY